MSEHRTNAEKRARAVACLTYNPEWSNRLIAEQIGVSHQFVANLRVDLGLQQTKRVGRTGRTHRIPDRRTQPRTPSPTHGEVAALTRENERLQAENESLRRQLAELRLFEGTADDFAASLGAAPVTFEAEEEFEAGMRALPVEPKRRRRK